MVSAEKIINNPDVQQAVQTATQKLGLATQEIGEILVHGKAMEGIAELSSLGLMFALTGAATYGAYRIAYTDYMSDYLIDEYDRIDDSDYRPLAVAFTSMFALMISASISRAIQTSMMKILAPKYMVLVEEILPLL